MSNKFNSKHKSKMEEEKKQLSYDELKQVASDLHVQYQKAIAHIQKLEAMLDDTRFNQTSFFVSMLFKVLEHPEHHADEFVKWTVETVEAAMKSFGEVVAGTKGADEKAKENEAE